MYHLIYDLNEQNIVNLNLKNRSILAIRSYKLFSKYTTILHYFENILFYYRKTAAFALIIIYKKDPYYVKFVYGKIYIIIFNFVF